MKRWRYNVVLAIRLAAVVAGVTNNPGQIHSPPAKRMTSALISPPTWLTIIPPSPIEAYATARSVARHA
jgi:hypothetical protein